MNIFPTHDSSAVREPNQRQAPIPPHRHNSENLAIERQEFLNRTTIDPPAPPRERRYAIRTTTNDEVNFLIEHIPAELLR